MLINIIFVIYLCIFNNIQTVVILVHGTFAQNSSWFKPRGDFYNIIFHEALKKNLVVVPFLWSGQLSHNARIEAAERLANTILSYLDKNITLIGHSHGGNIINLSTQIIAYMSGLDLSIDISNIDEFTCFNYKALCRNKKCCIDKVYLLATPVDNKNYYPNMHVVKNVYNLYSLGDNIQPIIGFYGRTYKYHKNIFNLRVIFNKTDSMIDYYDPSHYEMHNQYLAKWLLKIPNDLDKMPLCSCKYIRNSSFIKKRNSGILVFDKYNKPSLYLN